MACCHCEVTFGHTPEVEGQEDTSLLVPLGTSVPLLTGLFLSPFLDFPGPLCLAIWAALNVDVLFFLLLLFLFPLQTYSEGTI